MSAEKPTKINRLLQSQPSGVVLQSFWLAEQGYSLDLQKRYRAGKWLKSIGTGAMIRAGDKVGYEGAVYALQTQSNLSVHPGGKTALSLLGKAHYLEMTAKKITVFGERGEKLPAWFCKRDWGVKIDYHQTSFLPANLGIIEIELKNFNLKISGAVRALMECLYLAPHKQGIVECFELMEGLNNLRPREVQNLLEKCESVKVKRLFLYLAEKAGHSWLKQLNLKNIDLGSGKRMIESGGVYVAKYQITVPKELEADGKSGL
jgi:hypothetical protein